MSGLLNLIPAPLRAWAVLAVLILAVSILSTAYLTGRSHGWDAHVVVAEREMAIQEAANREAVRLAGEQYARTIDRLALEKDTLDAQLEDLATQAAADPDADQCGIGPGSVQRLNSIR